LRNACLFVALAILACLFGASPCKAGSHNPKVYLVLWFDTEDYLLPASDDAALKIARFLTDENIRATFKVVGEKTRTLERRGRADVIGALKKHEIGYHSNYHSVQPSPAMYLDSLGWDEGVSEFDRRERAGVEDVRRVFGCDPTCYGQPGSSWAPQTYGTMRRWGMKVYLDAGGHVNLDDRPCYYCGILNLYKLAYLQRVNLVTRDLKQAEDNFLTARRQLLEEGGGVVSVMYHPCEFVHQKFWDGVNFKVGANPPPEQWQAPPQKTPEETRLAFDVFEQYIQFLKRFEDVEFVTASQAARLYRDRAAGKVFTTQELAAVAAAVGNEIKFQKGDSWTASAAEIFWLLNTFVDRWGARPAPENLALTACPLGPTQPSQALVKTVATDWSQLTRTAHDVAGYLHTHDRIPPAVWLGSSAVPPEAYLATLARVSSDLIAGKGPPQTIEIRPARLEVGRYVADDGPRLWRWVIFPPGFHAQQVMALARLQAWTLKPALLDRGHPK
jgi:hypothetical protein